MKRSAALASLSRDHHQALVIAQQLRRAGEHSGAPARAAFLEYRTGHGAEHFRLEEEVLLPAYAAYGDPHHPLVLRALGDHVAIASERRPSPRPARLLSMRRTSSGRALAPTSAWRSASCFR